MAARRSEKASFSAPSVNEIVKDKLTYQSLENWGPESKATFSGDLVNDLYNNEIIDGSSGRVNTSRVMLLELSQYLERYLWPHWDPLKSSLVHFLSIIVMANEKAREGVSPFQCFKEDKEKFGQFFKFLMAATMNETSSVFPGSPASRPLSVSELKFVLIFLIECFQSLEESLVQAQVTRLVSLPLWVALSEGRRNKILQTNKVLQKQWTRMQQSIRSAPQNYHFESHFVPHLCSLFFQHLSTLPSKENKAEDQHVLQFCERFLELICDLLSQISTRRFLRTFLDWIHFSIRCRLSTLFISHRSTLFNQLVEKLEFYDDFQIDDITGTALTIDEVTERHCEGIQAMQVIAFSFFQPTLRAFALSNMAAIESKTSLMVNLSVLPNDDLKSFCRMLFLIPDTDDANDERTPLYKDNRFLLNVISKTFAKKTSLIDTLEETPVYPTDQIMWDDNILPMSSYSGEHCLSLPKLSLQYLSVFDYLWRNFHLFRLEAAYEIREDVEDAVKRMKPRKDVKGVKMTGWARMAQHLTQFQISHVAPPRLGMQRPDHVSARLSVDTRSMPHEIRAEWERIRPHDVLFLIGVNPSTEIGQNTDDKVDFVQRFGLKAVRGCQVKDILNNKGQIIDIHQLQLEGKSIPFEGKLNLLVSLDPQQYFLDVESGKGSEVYEGMNILLRRNGKENNFRAVLDTLRSLMVQEQRQISFLPEWLTDVFLGYGDPLSASRVRNSNDLDFRDTFVDLPHLISSFPSASSITSGSSPVSSSSSDLAPPFRIKFRRHSRFGLSSASSSKTSLSSSSSSVGDQDNELFLEIESSSSNKTSKPNAEKDLNRPQWYKNLTQEFEAHKLSGIKFTKSQVEAIESAMSEGLTMVVGPPGTGKTDVAVQIVHLLYHNFPQQRILLLTHSNQALNQLFEKIRNLTDIDDRHLVRLGHGEKQLKFEDSDSFQFSQAGRVDMMLSRRLELLQSVAHLAHSMQVEGDVGSSCETASYFFRFFVQTRWSEFLRLVQLDSSPLDAISTHFPFSAYFSSIFSLSSPALLFPLNDSSSSSSNGKSMEIDSEPAEKRKKNEEQLEEHLHLAHTLYGKVCEIFQQLEELRPFELLRTNNDRVNYLVCKQAKIIAMTCTHAALRRQDLVARGFKFDSIVMEESSQVLDIETFIPLLLNSSVSPLDRLHPFSSMTTEGQGLHRGSSGAQTSLTPELRRLVLIGDHNQLPPIIQNQSLQRYSRMSQSLFSRFVRLGVEVKNLEEQGRAREKIADLYRWRYPFLKNLPHVSQSPQFLKANAGFAHVMQLIDVGDLHGQGESEPTAHFFQNVAEAEYVVLMYQFMRLLGYPRESISILSSYNGQKHLIRDILKARCSSHPLFGNPHRVTTVDRYQGQQNDYILLSLVRTKTVGHIRDIRRLVVAMSRSRLGLYVFGRRSLFENCYELTKTFSQLVDGRSDKLQLLPKERYGNIERDANDTASASPDLVQIDNVEKMFEFVHKLTTERASSFKAQGHSVPDQNAMVDDQA